jgi:hypothetical protein
MIRKLQDHPELISDQEAITIFLITIMEPAGVCVDGRHRFDAQTHRMRLLTADSEVLWSAAHTFSTRFEPYRHESDALAKTIADPNQPADHEFAAQRRRIEAVANIGAVAQSVFADASTRMSPSGAAKLQDHLQFVKTKMKVIPSPKM